MREILVIAINVLLMLNYSTQDYTEYPDMINNLCKCGYIQAYNQKTYKYAAEFDQPVKNWT